MKYKFYKKCPILVRGTESKLHFVAKIKKPKVDIEAFLPVLGKYALNGSTQSRSGNIKIRENIYDISITEEKSNEIEIKLDNVYDLQQIGQIKKVVWKSTFCVQCEACEVECPTGALTIYPKINIDKDRCVHCHKCLDFHDKGCIAANSLYMTTGSNISKQANIDRYKNFGLKEEWVEAYFVDCDDFWTSNHGLNENYQIPSLKAWLRDAEIIDSSNKITELGRLLAECYTDNPDFVWEIIWINLSYNSFIVNWFNCNISATSQYSSKGMEVLIQEQFGLYKEKTIHNAVYQLQRTLKESPIGSSLCQMETLDKNTFVRERHENLSSEALAYSIYKYAERKNILSLRVSDFYAAEATGGPAKEFAISRSAFEQNLRALNSNNDRVLVAELNMGLDSITLREDLTALSCIKVLKK